VTYKGKKYEKCNWSMSIHHGHKIRNFDQVLLDFVELPANQTEYGNRKKVKR